MGDLGTRDPFRWKRLRTVHPMPLEWNGAVVLRLTPARDGRTRPAPYVIDSRPERRPGQPQLAEVARAFTRFGRRSRKGRLGKGAGVEREVVSAGLPVQAPERI